MLQHIDHQDRIELAVQSAKVTWLARIDLHNVEVRFAEGIGAQVMEIVRIDIGSHVKFAGNELICQRRNASADFQYAVTDPGTQDIAHPEIEASGVFDFNENVRPIFILLVDVIDEPE